MEPGPFCNQGKDNMAGARWHSGELRMPPTPVVHEMLQGATGRAFWEQSRYIIYVSWEQWKVDTGKEG